MAAHILSNLRALFLILITAMLFACGGGGGSGPGTTPPVGSTPTPTPVPTPEPTPEPTPDPIGLTVNQASRFLSQATFGPSQAEIDNLTSTGLETWMLSEFQKPASLHLQAVLAQFPADGSFRDERGNLIPGLTFTASNSFWQTAIEADDQLRQRMAFALSQIMVISSQGNLGQVPQTVASYMDVLTEGAFGNYRDLLENVTYSPAMAIYLTYLRNQKADPNTGRVPDENYARELMQLFSLGLVELSPDGTPMLNPDGSQVEIFDNSDITGLAGVFTGLSFQGAAFNAPIRFLPPESYYQPLEMFDVFHTSDSKTFLGTTIPANTNGVQSIDIALDTIFAHPNVGPFVGRQLIQRFVTSHPSTNYVQRVAGAFDTGLYALPSGTQIGTGQRGDLQATLAAILFDAEARDDSGTNTQFGKLREPVIRFTHWARAFQINSAEAGNEVVLRGTSDPQLLGQHPFRSPSVFNFYRPGYIAPGTETGAAGLTAPELQISNATTVVGYPNFLTIFALELTPKINDSLPATYVPNYSAEVALAADPEALLNRLDQLLTHGRLRAETRARITEVLNEFDATTEDGLQARARLASVLVMTSPEYVVLN